MTLEELIESGEANFWLTSEGLDTLSRGYLLPGETPRGMYRRVANSVASYLKKPELANKFYEYIDKNWLCLATPVASNCGTTRGLPISCFAMQAPDTLEGIYQSFTESAMLTKYGGGIAKSWSNLRQRGSLIGGNGVSDGIIPWLKVEDSTLQSTSQGGVRRGSGAQYLDINSNEIEEFLDIRRASGDASRRCLSNNFHHAVVVDDSFMQRCKIGDLEARTLWEKILLTRLETGEPYILFKDTANREAPPMYAEHGLTITCSNLCLSGDTLVLTDKGPREISDLVGQTVNIWDGKEWVSNSSFRMTDDSAELLEITLRDGSVFKCTPYHKFYVNEHEMKASDLQEGQYLDYSQPSKPDSGKKVDGAYLKGFLIAEGTHTQDRPLLWVYSTKYSCTERLIKSAEEVKEGKARTNVITKVGLVDTGRNRKQLTGLAIRKEELLPWTTDYKRHFPLDVYTWDDQSQSEFLAGLFDGDGCVSKSGESRCYQIASIHKNFLDGLRDFLKTKGVYSCVSLMRKGGKCDFNDGYGEYNTKDAFRLSISNISARKLSSLVSFSRVYNFDPDFVGYKGTPVFRQIKSVKKLEGKFPVYCTNVPSTHKFLLGNGVISGNCSEIILPVDDHHTFVCCLSSLNLARWDEWKDTDLIETAIWFLDGVMEEFISKARNIYGFERSVRFAEKSRALGLGVLGWHTFLQARMIPFESFQAMQLNNEIFKTIKERATKATQDLALEYGEVEWTKGFGVRNMNLTAVAPTMSNSLISGGVSQGIEPLIANYYAQKTAKGTFIRKNRQLEALLEQKGHNTFDVWEQINTDSGSVKNLSCLTDEEKAVFATAREINQFAIVRQAAQRQKYIDQGQSVNLFFAAPNEITDEERKKLGKYIHKVHWEAWESGLKSLYYLRASAILKGDAVYREESECLSCHA